MKSDTQNEVGCDSETAQSKSLFELDKLLEDLSKTFRSNDISKHNSSDNNISNERSESDCDSRPTNLHYDDPFYDKFRQTGKTYHPKLLSGKEEVSKFKENEDEENQDIETISISSGHSPFFEIINFNPEEVKKLTTVEFCHLYANKQQETIALSSASKLSTLKKNTFLNSLAKGLCYSTQTTSNDASSKSVCVSFKKELLNISVKKTGVFYDNPSLVPTYGTHSEHRGEVLIINNIMFKHFRYRDGAKVDDENLSSLFQQIGFKVELKRNLKKAEMESRVKTFSRNKSLKSADIAVVIVMSHGTTNSVLGGTEIFGIDEAGILVDNLIQHFSKENCKAMANKPKIFIFQCCRGNNEYFVKSDATRAKESTEPVVDALVAYSSLPGFRSHRDPATGTWYISTLCKIFSEHAHELHVEDLLKLVDVELNNFDTYVTQKTHYENRSFKRCYLHPK